MSDAVKNALRTATSIRPIKLATGGDATPAVDYGKPDDLGMFSHGAVLASKMPMAKGSPAQLKGYLTKQGVKPDEFKWSGYDEKLGGKPSVTREEVAKHFHENKPAIKEHVLSDGDFDYGHVDREGGPKFAQYTLPGGKNYREHLLTLPAKTSRAHAIHYKDGTQMGAAFPSAEEAHAEMQALFPGREDLEVRPERATNDGVRTGQALTTDNYKSSHWDQPNVLAHLRLSDRDLPNKQKALHLEELQSDWAQEGRTKGFKKDVTELPADWTPEEKENGRGEKYWEVRNGGVSAGSGKTREEAVAAALKGLSAHGLPQAPYVDGTSKWLDLGLKRALYEAAKGGHHKLVITPGEEQANRYDLSKHFDKVNYFPNEKRLHAYDPSGDRIYDAQHEPEELPGVIGKDVADKLLNSPKKPGYPQPYHQLQNADLKVGGEGMKSFYDKMLPQALQKLARKHDPAAEVKLHEHKLPVNTAHPDDYSVDVGLNGTGHQLYDQSGSPEGPEHPTYAAADRYRKELHAAGKRNVGLHSLDITPKMRESILKGHPHFESGGAVKARADGGSVRDASAAGRFTLTPEERRAKRQEQAYSNQLDYALRDTPEPDPSDLSDITRRYPTANRSPFWTKPEASNFKRGGIAAPAILKRATGGDVEPPADDDEKLLAVHNTRPDRLTKADQLGGFAVPSIAIAKLRHGFHNFGGISMIGDKDLIRPGKRHPVYGADVYSPRFPSLNDEGTKIFRGFTDMGNRRYAPLTMDNVVREMKGNIRSGEGTGYGAGTVRAMVTPQFKNLAAIQKNRHQIISGEDFEPHKEDANRELMELADKFHPHSKYAGNQWEHGRAFEDLMQEAGKRGPWALREHYKDLTPEHYEDVRAYLAKLKAMPTEYFEAKPQRGVAINEFRGAVVPHENENILPLLHKHGITRIERYKEHDHEAHRGALKKFADLGFKFGGDVEKLPKARGGSVNHAPSEAQKHAGNYAKEHISFQGLPITIENKMGSVRSGRGADGKAWSCRLPADYGYIKRTVGADGDHVDVYVGPHKDSHLVVAIHQHDQRTGKFDEHKFMLGFRSEHDALKCYCDGFSDGKGPDRLGHVETMSIDGLKKWLHHGRTTKPVARGSIVGHAMRLIAAKGARA